MIDTAELNVKIFQEAFGLSLRNAHLEIGDLITKWTHESIIKHVCQIELKALEGVADNNYHPMGHTYYSLYREYPNYGLMRKTYKEHILNLRRQFEYVQDDPSLLLSINDETSEIFRFILRDLVQPVDKPEEMENYRLEFLEAKIESKTFIVDIIETWALLYTASDLRSKVMSDEKSTIDNLMDLLSYFYINENPEIDLIIKLFADEPTLA